MLSGEVLASAAESFQFDRNTLVFISKSTNEVYRFVKDNSDYILRISDKPLNDILAEVHWVNYLANNGVRVSLPIADKNGQLAVVYIIQEERYVAMAFQMAPGVFFDHDPQLWQPSLFRKWGELMGKTHRLTKAYFPAGSMPSRPRWSAAKIDNPFLLEGDYRFLVDRLRSLENTISALPKDKNSYGLIHYDFHPYNFVIDREEITVFDFDDSIYGWFALDIGIAAAHAVWWGSPGDGRDSKREFAKRFLTEFLTGYCRENVLDHQWIERISLFMDYRNIASFFWWLSAWNGDESLLSDFQKRAIANGAELIKNGLPFDGCDVQL